MLIAQITDLHLGFDPGNPGEDNQRRLESVVARLIEGPNRPDLLIATGDLVDRGEPESYARVKVALSACPFPVHYMLGNHDDRGNFAEVFPDTPMPGGFAQYVLDLEGLRLVVLDTLEIGRHGGGFCETRAAWLAERLAEDRRTPTVIVMHHPPFATGIEWMNTHPDEPWVARFTAAVAGQDHVIAIWCGHIHRAIVASWMGKTVTICPSSSAELTLDLAPIDPDQADGRSMVIDGPPGYALHRWTPHGLVTLFDVVEKHTVLASYNERMQPLVRLLDAERS